MNQQTEYNINGPGLTLINKNRSRPPNIYICSIISVASIIAFSMLLSFVGLMLGDVMSFDTVTRFAGEPLLYLYNTIPLTLLMLLIYFVSSRIWVSYVLGGSFYIAIELVNMFKIQLRDDPLIPSDLILGGEVVNVVKPSELHISKYLTEIFILFVIIGLLLLFLVKPPKLGVIARISGAAVCVLVFVLLFRFIYGDIKRFDTFKVSGTIYNTTDIFRSRGFIYSFLVSFENCKLNKPGGYSAREAKELLDSYAQGSTDDAKNKPNVIAIMGEAFYNIDRIPGIKFIEGKNPLENYHKIIDEAYHGSIVTSVFGGGTSSTEFSFLTGNSTCLLPNGITVYKTHIRSNTNSLARYFMGNGYSSTAFHPGYEWFYNRQNVYKFFGFENIFFRADMNPSSYVTRRGYVTDKDAMEFILEDFDKHLILNPEKPHFNFTVTIENHSPYSGTVKNNQILVRPEGMTDEVYSTINNYLYGLREADKALGFLVSELRKRKEPYVFIFFGDHLPSFGKNYEGYKSFGYNIGQDKDIEGFLNNYRTPYFIWSNDAAKELLKKNGVPQMSGEGPDISACFLPVELMKYLGQKPSTYFEFLNRLEKQMPVITHKYYEQDGKYVTLLSEKNRTLLLEYMKLQYYMMFDNTIK